MHTVRNRLASRPPTTSAIPAGRAPPGRYDLPLVPRGSMALPLAGAEESGLIETRAQRRRNPKGKKARKAAARLAAAREAKALEPAICAAVEEPRPAKPAVKKAKAQKRPVAAERKPILPEQLPAIPMARTAPAAGPPPYPAIAAKPALTLPIRTEPLVEPEPARALPVVAAPELEAVAGAPPAMLLPPASEPEREPVPEPAMALAALADAPLPRSQALVPVRRQGLIDVIAFLLRDSGRRLARWSARRHRTRAEQAALRNAQARQLNLQRELEALDALRRNRG